ncbi:MAG: dTMP kinase [Lachnospiraceae bacterium]|nr:dTMP kinase [Lachnospiraceae bacterium]
MGNDYSCHTTLYQIFDNEENFAYHLRIKCRCRLVEEHYFRLHGKRTNDRKTLLLTNEHLYGKDGILEQTQKGNICICDRYIFSSFAYQSNECGMELPKKLNEDFPLPEYLFYFSINPEQSLKRITGRGVTEIYEKQDFLEKTKTQYDRIIADFKENSDIKIIEIDATSPIKEIEKIIWNVIEKLPIV